MHLIMPPTHRHRKKTHRGLMVRLLTASVAPGHPIPHYSRSKNHALLREFFDVNI
jgi:hypothetical protein